MLRDRARPPDSLVIDSAKLSHGLTYLAGMLEDADYINQDKAWKGTWPPPVGAQYAIANIKHVQTTIWELEQVADRLPDHRLVRKVKEQLALTFNCIGQVDVPAEFVMLNNAPDEAVSYVKEAAAQTFRKYGKTLERLAGQFAVACRDGLPRDRRAPPAAEESRSDSGSATWHFSPGEATYKNATISVNGIRWKLLKALAESEKALSVNDLIATAWEHDSDVDKKTVRTHLSELRKLLRRKLNMPDTFDPLPRQDRGALLAWAMDSSLR